MQIWPLAKIWIWHHPTVTVGSGGGADSCKCMQIYTKAVQLQNIQSQHNWTDLCKSMQMTSNDVISLTT